jgi:hypothetical protein
VCDGRERSAKGETERGSSREGAPVEVIIVLAEFDDLEHVFVLGLDLVEVLVVFSAIMNLLERERGSAPSRREQMAEPAHVEVGLLELVLVDGLDLDELWWRERKSAERRRVQGCEELTLMSSPSPSQRLRRMPKPKSLTSSI